MSKPTVQDMKDMNSLVRSFRREGQTRVFFRGGFDFEKSVVKASRGASFDNVPNHKIQRGFYVMVGDGNMMDDHAKPCPCMLLAWSSARIGRAVRSSLPAEAYSCSEAQYVWFWTRPVCADIFSASRLGRECRRAAEEWKGVLVGDCEWARSLIRS
eukprot:9017269-Pyramimonas_sp.AAC.1